MSVKADTTSMAYSLGYAEWSLGSGWTRREGPGGASVYLHRGYPQFARCPVYRLAEAAEFLQRNGVDHRIDLRDPSVPFDMEIEAPDLWEVTVLPVSLLDKEETERDRSGVYVRKAEEIWAAAEQVEEILKEETVPVLHCRAATDRTGTVIATLLMKKIGRQAAVDDFLRAAEHSRHPRTAAEIVPFGKKTETEYLNRR